MRLVLGGKETSEVVGHVCTVGYDAAQQGHSLGVILPTCTPPKSGAACCVPGCDTGKNGEGCGDTWRCCVGVVTEDEVGNHDECLCLLET